MKRYRWAATLDEHTCVECLQMDGRVFSQVEVDEMHCPPLHGQDAEHEVECRCVLVPTTDR
jgi:hypothetical protein